MQEAKRYEGWNVTHTVPYEVLNVANPTSARQAFTPVYQCITSSRVAHWMGIFMLDRRTVVSLDCRDETHPNARTGTRWHAIDPGMLPRCNRTVMYWSPRHDR